MTVDKHGEAGEAAALFAQHHQALCRFLTHFLGSRDQAADLAQESYLRFLKAVRETPAQDGRGLLFTIAANLARDVRRQQARRPHVDIVTVAASLPSPAASPEVTLEARRRLALVRDAIAELPPRSREVFLLFRLEGLSYRDIAGRLGISPRTVEYHVQHALRLCHRKMRGG
ncbi:RNA polymerase sigma factor [Oceanibaculum pacificum]|uniref:HTH luxR-type domain-containing protein n=1 Tax=Oceanibaculum pacificum TaxID=580166 RepID=A0A154VS33_9PROT|nr:sigma-70 family RNA polymerase sigma factor [Oceanibaculum pacificum]KZD04114.1 hypothetical protein AUP43_03140 [Oceanibaculum pacificum]